MKPSEIESGKTYIGRNGNPYTVNEITKRKNVKYVSFVTTDARGNWRLEDFAKLMKGQKRE